MPHFGIIYLLCITPVVKNKLVETSLILSIQKQRNTLSILFNKATNLLWTPCRWLWTRSLLWKWHKHFSILCKTVMDDLRERLRLWVVQFSLFLGFKSELKGLHFESFTKLPSRCRIQVLKSSLFLIGTRSSSSLHCSKPPFAICVWLLATCYLPVGTCQILNKENKIAPFSMLNTFCYTVL